MPVKIVGGTINRVKGNYTVVDRSRHVTDIESYNTYGNTVTDCFNNISKKPSEQFQHILVQGHLMTRLRCFFCS